MGCHQRTWSTTPSTEIGSSFIISIRTLSTWRPSSSFWWPASNNSIAAMSTCPKSTILCLILVSCCNSGTFWKSRDKDSRNSWAKATTLWTPVKSKWSMEIMSAWKYSSSSTSYSRSYKLTLRIGCLLCKLLAIPSLLVMTRFHCLSEQYQMIGCRQSETTSCSISVPCKDRAALRLPRITGISSPSRKMVLKASGLKFLSYQNPVSMASALTSFMSFIKRVGFSSKCTNRLC